jgi:hypothetical protein
MTLINIPIICRLQALPLGPPVIIDCVVEIYNGGLSSAPSSQTDKVQIVNKIGIAHCGDA